MGLLKTSALKLMTPERKRIRDTQERMHALRQMHNDAIKGAKVGRIDYRTVPDDFDYVIRPSELRRAIGAR